MTVICALHDPKAKCTWIGSDSLASIGGPCVPYAEKWVEWGVWAAAITGNRRMFNLIQENAKRLFDDLDRAFDFNNRLKDICVEDGFNSDTERGPKDYGQAAILANCSGVWSIGPCFEMITIPPGELYTEGSGRKYAFGAGAALQGGDAETIVRKAVDAAIRYDDGCGGDPWIDRLTEGPEMDSDKWSITAGVMKRAFEKDEI